MSNETPPIQATGKPDNLKSLLTNSHYMLDFYQREYRWQTQHVNDLLDDLTSHFSKSHDPSRTRSDVRNYGRYFLGTIIVNQRDDGRYIVDGQQRLTTLTLLLIYLRHRLRTDNAIDEQLAPMIQSVEFDERAFNLSVEERNACMEALYDQLEYDPEGENESVQNIMSRYADIGNHGVLEDDEALPYFTDWLIQNVDLIVITSHSEDEAYEIFETMNDRGLALTPAEMLRGYLLANVPAGARRVAATKVWEERTASLARLGRDSSAFTTEPSNAIRSWLRAKHAGVGDSADTAPADTREFERIGTEFHRWVRKNGAELGLTSSNAFSAFIEKDFKFFTQQFERIRRAEANRATGLGAVQYLSENNYTLMYPVLLAPLRWTDDAPTIDQKLGIVSTYLDIVIHRRIWVGKQITQTAMRSEMYVLLRAIRDKSPADLAAYLTEELERSSIQFEQNSRFALHGRNRQAVHRILARMTEFVERNSDDRSRYTEFAKTGKGGYDIEHIWPDTPDMFANEFPQREEFQDARNRIGGLILISRSRNRSLQDLPYEKKLPYYESDNILAQSLSAKAYEHNPGFLSFIERSGLRFRSHEEFNKADLDERQDLYLALAEAIWHPTRLTEYLDA